MSQAIETPKPTKPALPLPQPIDQVEVTWKVIVPGEPGVVWFALTPEEYEDLARNYADINRWVNEARGQLEYYRAD